MSKLSLQAESAAEKLLMADENQLYEQLGIRAKAIAEDPTLCGSFEPEVTYDKAQMGFMEDVREFGKRLFKRWNVEAHKLICGSDPNEQGDREKLVKAVGLGEVSVAGALSALLVTHLGLAPAIAAVVSALAIKRFFRPAYDEFCQTWEKSLNENL